MQMLIPWIEQQYEYYHHHYRQGHKSQDVFTHNLTMQNTSCRP